MNACAVRAVALFALVSLVTLGLSLQHATWAVGEHLHSGANYGHTH